MKGNRVKILAKRWWEYFPGALIASLTEWTSRICSFACRDLGFYNERNVDESSIAMRKAQMWKLDYWQRLLFPARLPRTGLANVLDLSKSRVHSAACSQAWSKHHWYSSWKPTTCHIKIRVFTHTTWHAHRRLEKSVKRSKHWCPQRSQAVASHPVGCCAACCKHVSNLCYFAGKGKQQQNPSLYTMNIAKNHVHRHNFLQHTAALIRRVLPQPDVARQSQG